LHERLLRQIQRHFGAADALPPELRDFVDDVGRAYARADEEQARLERSVEAAGLEIGERDRLLRLAPRDALWAWEPGSAAREWNDGLTGIFGYAADEVEHTQAWWADRVHPDDRERVLAGLRGVLDGAALTWADEYRFRRGDGSWATVVDRAHVTRVGGRAVRLVGSMVDAGERLRVEEALRESERQFRELAETIAAATFIYQGTRFVYVNAAATELTGYSREELLGMHFWELVHSDHRDAVRERGMARQKGDAVAPRYEFKIVTRDGAERWVDFTSGVIRYRGETAALGTAFDITRHKRAEEELRRQALAFANLYDAVIITDLAGRIVEWNPAAERTYGYTAAEVMGSTVDIWLDPGEAAWLNRAILGALEAEGRWSGEIRFVRKDGTPGVSETLVVPLFDSRGERVGALGVNRDITDRRRAEEALRTSEERYRLMVEGSEQVFFYVHDRDGVFQYLSPSVRDVLGYEADELAGRTFREMLTGDPGDAQVEERTRATLAAEEQLSTYAAVTRHRDGRRVVLELVETPALRDGAVVGVQGFARDITGRRSSEEALRESERRYRALFEESRDAIYMTGPDDRFIDVNQAALDLFGYTRDQMVGLDVREIYVHPTDRVRFQDEIGRSGYVRDYEVRLARADGTEVDCLLSANVRPGPDGRPAGMQGIIHDITERKRAEERLAYGALHDALTGLPNRALFVDRLGQAIERARRGGEAPFAVLFLDLDRFKVVNDSLGHGVGDRLLVALAARLEAAVGPAGTVARFGGDEFTLLLEDVPGALEASHAAERVLEALSLPFHPDGHEVFASASVGIALSSAGYRDAGELLRNADAALSRAKAQGKARYEVFDRAMHAEALVRLQMEMDLRRAVERGELRLVYQPVVSLPTGKVSGFEALVRWAHPTRGTISPHEFIPVAEETGLILPIGRWVVEEVCRHARSWRRAGGQPPLTVSLNLSAKQFAQPDMVEHIERTMDASGVDPALLKLEITESVILEDAAPAKAMLARLGALGVELYMDDFGTGFSSLGYLHRFALDGVKVDRSFVARMDTEHRSAQLVHAIVALARNLDLTVVAEGIEKPAQLAALRAMGCEYGQGFLFSPPIPRREAEQLLAADPTW
jgi:diguanylate cyclase (GGDEF)-like protein/PAS domain S-box-containing protein